MEPHNHKNKCMLAFGEVMEKSRSFPCSYSEMGLELEDRDCKSYSFNGPKENPEVKRRKRVASYNMYTTEGKLKSSLTNSFKWIKTKFTHDFYDS